MPPFLMEPQGARRGLEVLDRSGPRMWGGHDICFFAEVFSSIRGATWLGGGCSTVAACDCVISGELTPQLRLAPSRPPASVADRSWPCAPERVRSVDLRVWH